MKKQNGLKWMKGTTMLLLAIAMLVVSACSNNANSNNDNEDNENAKGAYPNAQLLVDPAWIAEHADDENVRIVDVRREGYAEGHVPGAVSFSMNDIHIPDIEIKNKLVDSEPFSKAIQNIGVNQDTTVVVYDDGNALQASRLFYALEYYGHTDVKILNGGYAGWLVDGQEVSTEAAEYEAGDFVATAQENKMVDLDYIVNDLLNSDDVIFIDARSEAEYTGEETRGNKKGGHIPNAVHVDWNEAVEEGEDGVQRFLPYEDLKELYAFALEGDKTLVPYCQTNIRGSHTYFSLRLLGLGDNISPYENSMIEWNNLEETPVET